MKKMFVGNLPQDATEQRVKDLFSEFGTVRSVHLVNDIFSGKCRGFGFVEMEGHEARAAIDGLNGKSRLGDKPLKIQFEDSRKKKGKR